MTLEFVWENFLQDLLSSPLRYWCHEYNFILKRSKKYVQKFVT
jgi:hypothetical protein